MQALAEGFYFDNYTPASPLESALNYGGKAVRILLSSAISLIDISLQVIHILAITVISALDHIESSLFNTSSTYTSNLQYFYLFIFTVRAFTKDHLQFIEERIFNTNLSNLSDKYFDFWNQ